MNKNLLHLYGNRRVLSVLGLGYSSGLPLALTGATLQAWMYSEGVDLKTIGLFSLVGIPYTLKILWSPLMDLLSPPWLGRRRGWIILTQFLLVLVIIYLSFSSPSGSPGIVAAFTLILAFLSASQDIVIDAYRADILHEYELGAGAASAVLGYRLAMLTSGAGAMILADSVPWKTVYSCIACIMLANTLITLYAPNPKEEAKQPINLKEAVWGPLTSFFHKRGVLAILLFVIAFKLGDSLASAMTTPFLLDLGFTKSEVGLVYKAFGLASTILGAYAGGIIVARTGINRSLWIFAFLQAISNLSFTVLALIGKSFSFMITAVAIENICGGMGTAGFVAFLMSLCDKRFTATQYALLTSLMGLTRIVANAPTGYMVSFMGWPMFYTLSILGALPAIILLPRFAPWNNPQDRKIS